MNIMLNNQRINLETALFRRVPPVQASAELNVVVVDQINNIRISSGEVEFEYIRNVKLNPYSLFDITLTFIYRASFDETVDKEKVENSLNKNYETVINKTTMPASASQIIANLTSVNGGAPLITPPIFVKSADQ